MLIIIVCIVPYHKRSLKYKYNFRSNISRRQEGLNGKSFLEARKNQDL